MIKIPAKSEILVFCSNTKLVSAYACYILEFFKLLNICTVYTFV